ncbi:MAG: hypothetical protein RI885_1415, partial [Actinomycetota bacterium]
PMTDPNTGSVPPVPPSGDPVTPPPAAPSTAPGGYSPPASPAPGGYSAPGYSAPSAPGYSAPAGYATAAPAAAPKTLSLIGMIAGILGVVSFGWFLPASIAALILGYMGKKREGVPAKGFWLTAIITGYVGIALTVLIVGGAILLAILGAAADGYSSGY